MSTSVRASQASYVVLPETITDKPTVLSFLIERFQQVGSDVWQARMADGKVHWQDGCLITIDTPFKPRARVYYYREVKSEAKVPFEEKILYQDEQIILAFKPHFLALHPSGNFVNECLVNRLRIKTGIETLVPAHRLDRATAGIVLVIVKPESRSLYHDLFKHHQITKEYQALAKLTPELLAQSQQGELQLPLHWTVKNRMVKGEPSFTMKVVEGEPNTHSEITLIDINEGIGLFNLSPITGRTHQLRVHMQSLGMAILNDKCYPNLLPKSDDDYSRPLKLVAKRLAFNDPVTQISLDIECEGFDAFSL